MNILEVCSGTSVNGAIIHCWLLSRELSRRGHRVTTVCNPGSWVEEQLAAEHMDFVCSDLHRWPMDELKRIARVIRTGRIDVIHTHLSSANFFGVLLRMLTGVPSVATAHACHIQPHWIFNDYVIACSDATRRYHHRYNLIRSSRIQTIRGFIDYRRMAEVPPDARSRVRASLAIDDSALLIGVISDVVPRKGLIHLIRALPRILRQVPGAWLIAVGPYTSPRYLGELQGTADRLGVGSHIRWMGPRNDVDEIMAALDLCVQPSLIEPLGMVILEAMAAGLPVVASEVGGIPECISPGETGVLVPPANSDALAEAIIPLLQDSGERRRLGEAGRKRVLRSFSPESQATRVEAVLAQVVQRKKAA